MVTLLGSRDTGATRPGRSCQWVPLWKEKDLDGFGGCPWLLHLLSCRVGEQRGWVAGEEGMGWSPVCAVPCWACSCPAVLGLGTRAGRARQMELGGIWALPTIR